MYLLNIFTKLLHFLPGEVSHHIALNGLKLLHRFDLLKFLLEEITKDKVILKKSNDVRTYENKLGIAAGLDKNGEYIDCLSALGVGFIEVGTVTPLEQYGNPKPRVFRLEKDQALINRLGFNNHGSEVISKRIANDLPSGFLGINIGPNKDTENMTDDFLRCAEIFFPIGDYITINISSPNTSGLRDFHDEDTLKKLLTKKFS